MPKRRKRQQQPQQITPSVPQVPTEPQYASDTSTVPTSPTPQRQQQPQTQPQPQPQQQPAVQYRPFTPAEMDEFLSMNPTEREMVQRARLDEALADHFESLDRQRAQAEEQYRQMVSNNQQSQRQLIDEMVGPGKVEYKQVGPPKRGRPAVTSGGPVRLYRILGRPTNR